MAYTSVIPVYRLDNAVRYAQDKQKTTRQHGMPLAETVDYALNREKTETDGFESGLGCTTQSAYEDMRANAVRWHKTDGVQGYHLVQSFAEGEVTPELAHKIGLELAERVLGGRYQAIVTTHLNTSHYHNHIVWSSVAMNSGRKYHSNAKSYALEIRAVSDELCVKYGLSIIQTERAAQVSKPYAEWLAEKNGQPTWRTVIRQDVDAALAEALTWRQFIRELESKGYELNFNHKSIHETARISVLSHLRPQLHGVLCGDRWRDGSASVLVQRAGYSSNAIKRQINPMPCAVSAAQGILCFRRWKAEKKLSLVVLPAAPAVGLVGGGGCGQPLADRRLKLGAGRTERRAGRAFCFAMDRAQRTVLAAFYADLCSCRSRACLRQVQHTPRRGAWLRLLGRCVRAESKI